jgi:hypothetical protein
LTRFCVLSFVFLLAVLQASIIDAAFKVFLTNGRVITEVDEIMEENGNVSIQKGGISLRFPRSGVKRVEEYMPAETDTPEEPSSGPVPSERIMVSPGPDQGEIPRSDQKEEIRSRDPRERYEAVIRKLERIQELEWTSKELESRIYRALRSLSPRNARTFREDKAEVDSELEILRREERALRKEKKRLERIPGISGTGGQEKTIEEAYGEREPDEFRELSDYDLETIESGILFRENPKLDFQLKDLEKRDKAGELPEQFKPYKDFLENQHQQLHKE